MPLDPEVQAELDTIRRELRDELRQARTPHERDTARGDAAADLDDVLRANGYRLNRRELDEIIQQRESDRIDAAVERALAARDAANDAGADGTADDSDTAADDGKPKPKKKATTAGKNDDDDEAEWK